MKKDKKLICAALATACFLIALVAGLTTVWFETDVYYFVASATAAILLQAKCHQLCKKQPLPPYVTKL